MRYVIELYGTSESVHGSVAREGCETDREFHGWLELLALLEPPPEPSPETGDGSSRT
ncbi:hypothetical protein OG897_28495 [Streptomyces sp. NBC_00237]|uniref:hypothetical protein n=1 Tax=Streptomyces sp. NBC_00237 TaxID=2975687 RepID=UPI0022564360|nr:hypothetical protein [Streptomyces sp. NBC_00237]MCX5205386.1 hypothetical protein [Streptomyces sp. NBC_00237]